MKFKMSQNSIFAVLMRSPWWMSAGLALLLSVGGAAALPRDFAAVGVFAAVPFVVIAVLAGVRQWRQPSEERVLAVAQALAGMGWKRRPRHSRRVSRATAARCNGWMARAPISRCNARVGWPW